MTKKGVEQPEIKIYGAREHNLKNIDLTLPREKLVVITGLSGSGKSSLAFDTLFAEGQRRYLESFSAYARQFIGNLERPNVDKIEGLSPVISIEQKTTNRNPRSTVGTITEVYDFLRLLYARVGNAYSYLTGNPMQRLSEDQIRAYILEKYKDKKILLLAPLIRARKGHYRELFERYFKAGYLRMRVNGEVVEITPKMQLDRYKQHDIELVVDRITADEDSAKRLMQSVKTAMHIGKGIVLVVDPDTNTESNYSKYLMDPQSGLSYDEPQPNTFSFNAPAGACQTCDGLGKIADIDLNLLIPDANLSITQGGIAALGQIREIWIFKVLQALSKKLKFSLSAPINKLTEDQYNAVLYGSPVELAIPSNSAYTANEHLVFEGVVPMLKRHYADQDAEWLQKWAQEYMSFTTCPTCNGARLKQESLHYRIGDQNIAQLADKEISALVTWFNTVTSLLNEQQNKIAADLIVEIKTRLQFLSDIGLDYLTLSRGANTLSGGESQRIRLATQIGSQLVGVLYILDEPSIGLHQRDNHKLIQALKNLRDLGNTVIVVEHDRDMILQADYVVDIGPGAGFNGGSIIAQGTPDQFVKQQSNTAAFINRTLDFPTNLSPRAGNGKMLSLLGASGNNLQMVDLHIPLGKFICVTGVSGSGKSSTINQTLYPILSHHFYRSVKKPLPYRSITGLEHIDKVIEIDQSPIGRSPRSNPATYTNVFTDIRNLFAELPESKIRGYKSGRFSFNVKGGRCETCQGAGIREIEMNFLPSVSVECETCQGKRYNRETLEIRYKGKSINDVLNLSIADACLFFENIPSILRKIATLNDVGLGYINLGQPSTTLSGGEAQRVKLATELAKRDTGKTLYILDEPTTGLHFQDVKVLSEVLQQLVNKGNTVLVIEHNLDVIKQADHVIDFGPEGGKNGGKIIFEGNVSGLLAAKNSLTGEFLRLDRI